MDNKMRNIYVLKMDIADKEIEGEYSVSEEDMYRYFKLSLHNIDKKSFSGFITCNMSFNGWDMYNEYNIYCNGEIEDEFPVIGLIISDNSIFFNCINDFKIVDMENIHLRLLILREGAIVSMNDNTNEIYYELRKDGWYEIDKSELVDHVTYL